MMMFKLRGPSPRSTYVWTVAAPLLLLTYLASPAGALYATYGSPCYDVCSNPTNTTSSEIVCLDESYNSTEKGRSFQKCVSCELQSNYTDADTEISDFAWGLYNLRFAFDTCVYGYPEAVNTVSTPCLVACLGLSPAFEFELLNPTYNTLRTYCATGAFADNHIDTCSNCYNLTSTQGYLANFLEAMRYECHFPVPVDTAFPISPSEIFSEVQLPFYSTDLLNSTSHDPINYRLATLIGLPVMGFVICVCLFILSIIFCCQWRRRYVRRERASEQQRWKTLVAEHPWRGPAPSPQEMYPPGAYQQPQPQPQPQPPGHHQEASGFHFVDNDGRSQMVGYSKQQVKETTVAVQGELSPEEKGKGPEDFFPVQSDSKS
ncbi:uncharacterized protein BP01DRAFT_380571 [Aspergillus saccharolyticus JOP 1030-1]|uniref:Uncharacterized protein n=1 Tax=Aspergillus saccharolyticus JOP 1030-1 TaxID=1450539 RepID=A0A318ZKQ4_9EURO|nr:hypothetical protein BP01DRAFT_380571 [Aspergillus saccharolyticus JOP 1030-1]PYH47355.1 hypothetical protein BP01DRAFT_380571 [Aspergillus saccharolyticus JOP 1030-1]